MKKYHQNGLYFDDYMFLYFPILSVLRDEAIASRSNIRYSLHIDKILNSQIKDAKKLLTAAHEK